MLQTPSLELLQQELLHWSSCQHSMCWSLSSLCQLPHWPDTPMVARSLGTLPGHTPAPGGGDQPLKAVCGCHAMVAFSHTFPGLALLAPAASLASGASPSSDTPCRLPTRVSGALSLGCEQIHLPCVPAESCPSLALPRSFYLCSAS